MTGKDKCNHLKRYRNKIAEINGIDFKAKECDFQGDCPGYCPACDEEILLLEKELRKKERQGFDIKLQGLIKVAFKNGDTVHEYTPAPRNDRVMLGRIVHREPSENKSDADKRFEEAIKKLINHPSNDDNEVKINEDNPAAEPQENKLIGNIAVPDERYDWFATHNRIVDDDMPDDNNDDGANEDNTSLEIQEGDLLGNMISPDDDTDTWMGDIDQDYLDELFADDEYDDDVDDEDDDDDDDDGDGTTFLGWIEDPNGDW